MKKNKKEISTNNENDLDIFSKFDQKSYRRKPVIKSSDEPPVGVSYTRVSSKEQYDTNGSIDTQIEMVRKLSESRKIPIVAIFGGTFESAKSEERKEFQRMMTFIRKSKHNIKYILVSDIDRFSRTGGNAIYIASQLRASGIQILAASSPFDTLNPSGALHQDMLLLFSSYDNQVRAQKCVRGMKDKYLKGLYFGRPPLGYEVVKTNDGSKIVINDKGRLLAKAFRWKAEGKSIIEIAKRLKKLGLVLTDKRLSWAFRNVFYCGLLRNNLLGDTVLEGKNWEPIVSKKLFLEVNEVLEEGREKFQNHKEDNNIPLRHMVGCEKCKKPMTGYVVKAKGLFYYKCNTKGCGSNTSAKAMHSQFVLLLDSFQPDKKFIPLIRKQMQLSFIKIDSSLAQKQEDFSVREKEIKERIEKLEERFVMQQISDELFQKFHKKFKAELMKIRSEMKYDSNGLSNLEKLVEKSINLSQNISQYWVSASFYQKQQLQKAIFPDKIYYQKKKGTYRTTKVNIILLEITRLARVLEDSKQKSPSKKSRDSHWVDLVGIEPTSG